MRSVLWLAFLTLATGCATMVNGRYQTIEVDSFPTGAAVSADCGRATLSRHVTPAVLRAERSASRCVITFSHDGYDDRVIALDHQQSRAAHLNAAFAVPGAIVFGILGAMIGSVVDGADTGVEIGIEAGADAGYGGALAVDNKGGALKWVPGKVYALLIRSKPPEAAAGNGARDGR